jgi:hypothetical protein
LTRRDDAAQGPLVRSAMRRLKSTLGWISRCGEPRDHSCGAGYRGDLARHRRLLRDKRQRVVRRRSDNRHPRVRKRRRPAHRHARFCAATSWLVPVQYAAGLRPTRFATDACSTATARDHHHTAPSGERNALSGSGSNHCESAPRGLWTEARHRPPCRRAVLPLVVGQLLHIAAVVGHHEQLAVRLRSIGVHHLVLEAHA